MFNKTQALMFWLAENYDWRKCFRINEILGCAEQSPDFRCGRNVDHSNRIAVLKVYWPHQTTASGLFFCEYLLPPRNVLRTEITSIYYISSHLHLHKKHLRWESNTRHPVQKTRIFPERARWLRHRTVGTCTTAPRRSCCVSPYHNNCQWTNLTRVIGRFGLSLHWSDLHLIMFSNFRGSIDPFSVGESLAHWSYNGSKPHK